MERLGNIPLGLVITLLGLALAFLAPAVIILVVRSRKHASCTMRTVGTLTGWQRRYDSDNITYHPIYEYEANGVMQQRASNYSSASFNKKHGVGSQVELFYNPTKPQSFYVTEEDAGVNIITGAFFAVAGILLAVLCVVAFFYARG